jgi:hypothetical protein
MEKDKIDWLLVCWIGVNLGATQNAANKWKQRKMVPHKWRSGLVRATRGQISWAQFEELDRARDAL